MLRTLMISGAVSALMAGGALAQDVTLRLAHFAAETHPGHIAAQSFAEAVAPTGALIFDLTPPEPVVAPPRPKGPPILR